MFALIDGNNFYVSCERIFRPSLRDKPVVVLSNNDGCAISRSEEAKRLGIKMGQPFFEIRHLEVTEQLVCLSANFELYGDMSDRMMTVAAGLGPKQEIYSIDECFIGDLQGIAHLTQRAKHVRERILDWVGIPTCIGIAPTKTLAKLCNHVAKDAERKPGSYPAALQRVCNWNDMSATEQEDILARTHVSDVWGIGRKVAARLATMDIFTALDLMRLPALQARNCWSVMLERTVRELQGTSCIAMEEAPPPKQQIACTRSFGRPVTELGSLIEAVSEFASRAAEKLRQDRQLTSAISVFAHTSPFRDGPRFYRTATAQLQQPTADTKVLVNAAVAAITRIYEPGYQLSKAGVMLLDLCPEMHFQQGLQLWCTDNKRDQTQLMQVMDRLNARYGKGTLHVASAETLHGAHKEWSMKQERRTPCYTTRLRDIPIARA